MTPPPHSPWNEAGLSEEPAVAQLEALGWTYVAPETLETERESLKEVVLVGRLREALTKLNPWLTEDNLHKAVRAITAVPAASLIEASEKIHTTLTFGGSAQQDRGHGKKGQNVRYLDFEHPKRNEFAVTRQYRVQGSKKQIRPDIVLFVNGIPLVVIECKSPTLTGDWKAEAIEQLGRYQELEHRFFEMGAPKLFEPVQLLLATCGQAAMYGTVTTPHRCFAEWKSPWPYTVEELAADLGHAPTPQEILFAGMLRPEAVLDLTRNFIVFEHDSVSGKTLRKVCRYQQFQAVNKALQRARTARKPTDRGGVVWHTQGSGKSLTMLWLALKLRRDPAHENPTLVIVTDRRDLDDQISRTFLACGFPNPEQAGSVRALRALLAGPTGKTILTTIQKFQELADDEARGRSAEKALNEARNVFVLTDEAHRTQYGSLAAGMRQALPNAAFYGFSGTPIDKKDRSTLSTFGPYIDTYTIEQAVADEATVPIFYESRLPELRVVGNTLDQLFDRVFSDRSAEEREAIKKRYANEQTLAGAPSRVEAICLDCIEHYTKFIQPNGFKAQIVTCSRENAALYKETLDRLNGPMSAVVMSTGHNDEARLAQHALPDNWRKTLLEDRFLKAGNPLSILVVCDMLITGFDAPIEQVMYLDSPLREHTLLQAIARVNRKADGKTYGLVVDYWGVSEALQEALAIFSPNDLKGALTPKTDELPRLEQRHAAAVRFFAEVRDRGDLDACIRALEPEDVRAAFDEAFRKFSQSLDMLLPDPRALPFVKDGRWLGKVRAAAATRYRDSRLDISDCGAKVRQLIEDAVAADGIQILVKNVPLFSPEFDERLAVLKTPEAKASEMEHALRNEIHVRLDTDPAFYASLRERLEQIIADRRARRIDAAEQLSLFEGIEQQLQGRGSEAEAVGLSTTGFAIYGLLRGANRAGSRGPVDEAKVALAGIIEETLACHAGIVDWIHKDDVQREMRRLTKRHLKAAGFEDAKAERLAEELVELMKRRRGPG